MFCLFNHPRSEGWSLHGQVYSISLCPLSPSVVCQKTFPFHFSMLSIHHILGLPCFLAPGRVPSMIFFSRQFPSFLIFLLLIMLSSYRYTPAVSLTYLPLNNYLMEGNAYWMYYDTYSKERGMGIQKGGPGFWEYFTKRRLLSISFLSGSLALEAILIGVHCKKRRYINVYIQYNLSC